MRASHLVETGGKKLGILILSRQPASVLEAISGLCCEAARRGVEVEMFLMGDGVLHLGDPHLEEALKQGARISFCALNAIQRGLDQNPQYPWGAEESSQYELACIVERADRFLSFT
jgi:sulfur relay (sulfurtransferase) complex TusBCD TusD component (DsrE family)